MHSQTRFLAPLHAIRLRLSNSPRETTGEPVLRPAPDPPAMVRKPPSCWDARRRGPDPRLLPVGGFASRCAATENSQHRKSQPKRTGHDGSSEIDAETVDGQGRTPKALLRLHESIAISSVGGNKIKTAEPAIYADHAHQDLRSPNRTCEILNRVSRFVETTGVVHEPPLAPPEYREGGHATIVFIPPPVLRGG